MITLKNAKSLKDYDSVSLAEMLREHFKASYPVHQTEALGEAIQVASYLHRSDVRRGGRGKMPNPPYIEHPLRVAYRLVRDFGVTDPDVVLAAVLHDTVEDHAHEFVDFEGVNFLVAKDDEKGARARALEFISEHFGYSVTYILDAVSNPLLSAGVTKAEKVQSYLEHVERTVEMSPEARILKFSDFVDNAGSLHHHYEVGDSGVNYFLDRYAPLLPIYRKVFGGYPTEGVYLPTAVLARLSEVKKQFDKFEAGRA